MTRQFQRQRESKRIFGFLFAYLHTSVTLNLLFLSSFVLCSLNAITKRALLIGDLDFWYLHDDCFIIYHLLIQKIITHSCLIKVYFRRKNSSSAEEALLTISIITLLIRLVASPEWSNNTSNKPCLPRHVTSTNRELKLNWIEVLSMRGVVKILLIR